MDNRVKPRIKIADDDMIYYFRLCKSGFASSVKEAMELDARTVIQGLHYEEFLNEYEAEYYDLNK